MVPGSTLRYGSNFCSVTRRPRLSSRHPMDAAAIPFPSDETTPPVTKMYLAMSFRALQGSFKQLGYALQVGWRIHAQGFVFGFHNPYGMSVLERSELLEALGFFQRTDGQ